MSSGKDITICPFCLFKLSTSPGKRECRCEKCGRVIDPDEWVAPERDDDKSNRQFSAASIRDLEPVDQYYPPAIKENSRVKRETDITCVIDRLKGLRIGSDKSCEMRIVGWDKVLSIIVDRNRGEGKPNWWIYDFSNAAGTFVNRKRVLRVRALSHEDRIVVAGVPFRFECQDDKNASLVPLHEDANDRSKPIINVKNLKVTKDDGGNLLNVSDFEVRKGDFVAIMGPSGCGKSSLIQRIARLAPSDPGTIESETIEQGEFVYLPQDVERSLHPSMTLEQEIQCYRKIYRLYEEDDKLFGEQKDKFLWQLNLTDKDKGSDRIGKFSGGEKRRVGLALALLRDPKILLLDEPFAGLDPENERKLTDELYKLAKNDARTIVCVTHGLANKEVFDRLLILGKGGSKRAYDAAQRLPPLDELLTTGDETEEMGIKPEKDKAVVSQGVLMKLRARISLKSLMWKNRCVRTLKDMKDDLDGWMENLPAFKHSEIMLHSKRVRRVVSGYLSRYWNENACGDAWYKSNLAIYWFLLPLLIVLGIRFSCAYNFIPNNSEVLTCCMALALFWLGDVYCSQALVRNRKPSRCLERLGGVSTPAYLLSKYLWVIGFCLAQTLVFALMILLVSKVPLELSRWNESKMAFDVYGPVQKLDVGLFVVLPLFVASLLGGFWGLAMSAVFKTELKATAWATNLAIFALLFSDCIVNIKEVCLGWIAPVVKFMPCYWPSQWMNNILRQPSENWIGGWESLFGLACHFVLTFVLVCFFEWKNERSWQGRDVE